MDPRLFKTPAGEPRRKEIDDIVCGIPVRNPAPERLPPVPVAVVVVVRPVDAASSHDQVEALNELEIGVLQQELEIAIGVCDGSFAVEQAGGPGDLLRRSHLFEGVARLAACLFAPLDM